MKHKYFINTKRLITAAFAAALLCGCQHELQTAQQPSQRLLLRIKSERLSVAGQGTLREESDKQIIKLYSGAQPVAKINLSDRLICINKECASHKGFNDGILGLKTTEPIMLKLLKFQRLDGFFERKNNMNAHDIYKTSGDNFKHFFNKTAEQIIKQNSVILKTPKAKILIKRINNSN